MRIFILTILVSLFSLLTSRASSSPFDPQTKYRFVCKSYNSGALTLGANHHSTALLYYDLSNTIAEDAWWYIRNEGTSYTLINALSGQYITYNSNRVENVQKGLILTDTLQRNHSLWTITPNNQHWSILNVEEPTQGFNVRIDNTFLVGTYPYTGTDNELFSIYDEQGNLISPHNNTGSEKNINELTDSLHLGNKQMVFDYTSRSFLMPLNISLRKGGNLNTTLHACMKPAYANCTLTLNGMVPDAGTDSITLEDVNCQSSYWLELKDAEGKCVARNELKFTWMPVVEINMPDCNSNNYTTGNIRVTNADATNYDSLYIAAFKYRGATSLRQSKKSFNVKMRDIQGNSVDRSFLGLRNDNNWILDAMATDKSCMRNRIATDLWNDFSIRPAHSSLEPKARTGTRGRFVEVIYNGNYQGIYCMTEKMDRKQLRLKKFVPAAQSTTRQDEVHGILYKAIEWSYESLMGHYMDQKYFPGTTPSNYYNYLGNEGWCGYEFKYPDYKTEAIDWKPLWDAINFVATQTGEAFERGIANYFNLANAADYYLFIELLLTTDNHGKNLFTYIYDLQEPGNHPLQIAPWDLDGSWGARWDGSTHLTYAEQDFDEFLWQHEHGQGTLFHKLKQTSPELWNEPLAKRYAELRNTFFNRESLQTRVMKYATLFNKSNAEAREKQRWPQYHGNINEQANYMCTWISKRLNTLDAKYGYDPDLAAINEVRAENYLSATGSKGRMAITVHTPQTIRIYRINGQMERIVDLQPGLNTVNGLQPGIYLVGKNKVAVH